MNSSRSKFPLFVCGVIFSRKGKGYNNNYSNTKILKKHLKTWMCEHILFVRHKCELWYIHRPKWLQGPNGVDRRRVVVGEGFVISSVNNKIRILEMAIISLLSRWLKWRQTKNKEKKVRILRNSSLGHFFKHLACIPKTNKGVRLADRAASATARRCTAAGTPICIVFETQNL